MPNVEFSGMPRSGKTTVLKYLLHYSNNIIIHEERFDLVPYKDDSSFKYNLWYAKYCVNRLKKLIGTEKIHLFDRGILDRIAFGRALAFYGRFTSQQLKKYLTILEPYTPQQDLIFIHNMSPEVSLKYSRGSKKTITRDLRFLKYLNKAYAFVSKYKNAYYLPAGTNIKECVDYVLGMLHEHQVLASDNSVYAPYEYRRIRRNVIGNKF